MFKGLKMQLVSAVQRGNVDTAMVQVSRVAGSCCFCMHFARHADTWLLKISMYTKLHMRKLLALGPTCQRSFSNY
jgi:hypothetical protein